MSAERCRGLGRACDPRADPDWPEDSSQGLGVVFHRVPLERVLCGFIANGCLSGVWMVCILGRMAIGSAGCRDEATVRRYLREQGYWGQVSDSSRLSHPNQTQRSFPHPNARSPGKPKSRPMAVAVYSLDFDSSFKTIAAAAAPAAHLSRLSSF